MEVNRIVHRMEEDSIAEEAQPSEPVEGAFSPTSASTDDAHKKRTKRGRTRIRGILRLKRRKGAHSDEGLGALFGRSLASLCQGETLVKPLMYLLHTIYENGPLVEGVFRKCPNANTCREAKRQMDSTDFDYGQLNVYIASSLLKELLRSLPECLLCCDKYTQWLAAYNSKTDLKRIVCDLPANNRLLLRHLICVLHAIHRKSDYTKMTSHNLAVCLGPSLLWSKTATLDNQRQSVELVVDVVRALIDHAEFIFGAECLRLFGNDRGDLGARDDGNGRPVSAQLPNVVVEQSTSKTDTKMAEAQLQRSALPGTTSGQPVAPPRRKRSSVVVPVGVLTSDELEVSSADQPPSDRTRPTGPQGYLDRSGSADSELSGSGGFKRQYTMESTDNDLIDDSGTNYETEEDLDGKERQSSAHSYLSEDLADDEGGYVTSPSDASKNLSLNVERQSSTEAHSLQAGNLDATTTGRRGLIGTGFGSGKDSKDFAAPGDGSTGKPANDEDASSVSQGHVTGSSHASIRKFFGSSFASTFESFDADRSTFGESFDGGNAFLAESSDSTRSTSKPDGVSRRSPAPAPTLREWRDHVTSAEITADTSVRRNKEANALDWTDTSDSSKHRGRPSSSPIRLRRYDDDGSETGGSKNIQGSLLSVDSQGFDTGDSGISSAANDPKDPRAINQKLVDSLSCDDVVDSPDYVRKTDNQPHQDRSSRYSLDVRSSTKLLDSGVSPRMNEVIRSDSRIGRHSVDSRGATGHEDFKTGTRQRRGMTHRGSDLFPSHISNTLRAKRQQLYDPNGGEGGDSSISGTESGPEAGPRNVTSFLYSQILGRTPLHERVVASDVEMGGVSKFTGSSIRSAVGSRVPDRRFDQMSAVPVPEAGGRQWESDTGELGWRRTSPESGEALERRKDPPTYEEAVRQKREERGENAGGGSKSKLERIPPEIESEGVLGKTPLEDQNLQEQGPVAVVARSSSDPSSSGSGKTIRGQETPSGSRTPSYMAAIASSVNDPTYARLLSSKIRRSSAQSNVSRSSSSDDELLRHRHKIEDSQVKRVRKRHRRMRSGRNSDTRLQTDKKNLGNLVRSKSDSNTLYMGDSPLIVRVEPRSRESSTSYENIFGISVVQTLDSSHKSSRQENKENSTDTKRPPTKEAQNSGMTLALVENESAPTRNRKPVTMKDRDWHRDLVEEVSSVQVKSTPTSDGGKLLPSKLESGGNRSTRGDSSVVKPTIGPFGMVRRSDSQVLDISVAGPMTSHPPSPPRRVGLPRVGLEDEPQGPVIAVDSLDDDSEAGVGKFRSRGLDDGSGFWKLSNVERLRNEFDKSVTNTSGSTKTRNVRRAETTKPSRAKSLSNLTRLEDSSDDFRRKLVPFVADDTSDIPGPRSGTVAARRLSFTRVEQDGKSLLEVGSGGHRKHSTPERVFASKISSGSGIAKDTQVSRSASQKPAWLPASRSTGPERQDVRRPLIRSSSFLTAVESIRSETERSLTPDFDRRKSSLRPPREDLRYSSTDSSPMSERVVRRNLDREDGNSSCGSSTSSLPDSSRRSDAKPPVGRSIPRVQQQPLLHPLTSAVLERHRPRSVHLDQWVSKRDEGSSSVGVASSSSSSGRAELNSGSRASGRPEMPWSVVGLRSKYDGQNPR